MLGSLLTSSLDIPVLVRIPAVQQKQSYPELNDSLCATSRRNRGSLPKFRQYRDNELSPERGALKANLKGVWPSDVPKRAEAGWIVAGKCYFTGACSTLVPQASTR